MKKQLSFLIWAFCFCAGFAQTKALRGIWVEYKREVYGDTAISKYAIDGKKLHPNLYFTATKKDFFYSNPLTTELFEYAINGDTLVLTGFDKHIYTRSFRFRKTTKKELMLTEFVLGLDSTAFTTIHYFYRSRKYPPRGEDIYLLHKKKDLYPRFPGGDEELKKFYSLNYKKPASIDELNYDPVVQVMLTIDSGGKIVNAEIIGQPLKEFAEEAIRLIKLMPTWDNGPKPVCGWVAMNLYNQRHNYTFYPIEIVFKSKM